MSAPEVDAARRSWELVNQGVQGTYLPQCPPTVGYVPWKPAPIRMELPLVGMKPPTVGVESLRPVA